MLLRHIIELLESPNADSDMLSKVDLPKDESEPQNSEEMIVDWEKSETAETVQEEVVDEEYFDDEPAESENYEDLDSAEEAIEPGSVEETNWSQPDTSNNTFTSGESGIDISVLGLGLLIGVTLFAIRQVGVMSPSIERSALVVITSMLIVVLVGVLTASVLSVIEKYSDGAENQSAVRKTFRKRGSKR